MSAPPYENWLGPNGTSINPTSGDFSDPENWGTGQIPTNLDAIYLSSGDYAVALIGGSGVASIVIDEGATLAVSGGDSVLETYTDSRIYGGKLALSGGATLSTIGQLYNLGMIDLNQSAAVNGTILNGYSGTVEASGGINDIWSTFTNQGTVLVTGGATLSFIEGLQNNVTNLANGALPYGGRWIVSNNGTIQLPGASITHIMYSTSVILGQGSTFESSANGGSTFTTLEQSLSYVGGELVLNRNFKMASSFLEVVNLGTLLVQNGSTLSGTSTSMVSIDKGGKLGGSGVIATRVVADVGSIIAAAGGGSLIFTATANTFLSTFSGPGTVDLGGDTTYIAPGASLKSGGLTLGSNNTEISTSLTYSGRLTIGGNRTLVVLDGNKFNASKATTTLSDTSVLGGTLYLGSGAVNGTVYVQSTLVESGTLSLASGAYLVVTGRETGTGTLAAGGNSIIELGGVVSATQTVRFSDAGSDALYLDAPSTFRGVLSNFGSSDRLDLGGFSTAAEKFTYTENTAGTGGTLKVSSGPDRAVIAFDGQFVASGFHLASDSHGGTAITYAAPIPPPPGFTVGHA